MDAQAFDLDPTGVAVEYERHNHDGLQGVALGAAGRPGIGFAARDADGEVEDVPDHVARDTGAVVPHLDHVLSDRHLDPRCGLGLLGRVERVVDQLLDRDLRPHAGLVPDLCRQLTFGREVEQPGGGKGLRCEDPWRTPPAPVQSGVRAVDPAAMGSGLSRSVRLCCGRLASRDFPQRPGPQPGRSHFGAWPSRRPRRALHLRRDPVCEGRPCGRTRAGRSGAPRAGPCPATRQLASVWVLVRRIWPASAGVSSCVKVDFQQPRPGRRSDRFRRFVAIGRLSYGGDRVIKPGRWLSVSFSSTTFSAPRSQSRTVPNFRPCLPASVIASVRSPRLPPAFLPLGGILQHARLAATLLGSRLPRRQSTDCAAAACAHAGRDSLRPALAFQLQHQGLAAEAQRPRRLCSIAPSRACRRACTCISTRAAPALMSSRSAISASLVFMCASPVATFGEQGLGLGEGVRTLNCRAIGPDQHLAIW